MGAPKSLGELKIWVMGPIIFSCELISKYDEFKLCIPLLVLKVACIHAKIPTYVDLGDLTKYRS